MTAPREGTPAMSPADFQAWLDHMGLNQRSAAAALGISPTSIVKYRREGAPLYIERACAAIAAGLPTWRLENPMEQFNVMLDLRGDEAAEEIAILDEHYRGRLEAFAESLATHRVGSKRLDCDVSTSLPQTSNMAWTPVKALGLTWRLGIDRKEPAFVFAAEVEPFPGG